MSWPRCGTDGLLTPRRGRGVCTVCLNLIQPGHDLCRACRSGEQHLDVVAPISYSLGGGWLHTQIVAYKREADPFVPAAAGALAEMLERFLANHERCVGQGELFDVVTTVPSGDANRDRLHPLRRIVGEMVPSTRERHRRLLLRSDVPCRPRAFNRRRYRAVGPLNGERVLLVDDMWTTGASAQSAAAALLAAGASTVSAVVIARHLNRHWADNLVRLQALEGELDWSACLLCRADSNRAGSSA